MTEEKAKRCIHRNSLGECIEWEQDGSVLVAKFKEEEQSCNKELYEEWKRMVKDKRLRVEID